MRQSQSLRTVAVIAVTSAAVSLLIQACGGGAHAQAPEEIRAEASDAIEGAWDSTITIQDCSSKAVVMSFRGASLFHRGGTLAGDDTLPPPSRGAAIGVWKRGAGNTYTANLWFNRFNADGSVAGTQKVMRNLTLSANGDGISGDLVVQIISPTGAVLQKVCGKEEGVRTTW